MKPKSGTYALILQSNSKATVQIGQWGKLVIEPSYYIYVGSAFGPGGVRARVLRHFRQAKAKHWHIDYLREFTNPVYAWCNYGSIHLEHEWAQLFSNMANTFSIKGFGCSDCKCHTHLFTTIKQPDFLQFTDRVSAKVESCAYQATQ